MISDIDDALSALLRAEVLRDQSADVVFDAPTTQWAARRNGPVVDAFMYDIREDVERRDAQAQPIRDGAGKIVGYVSAGRDVPDREDDYLAARGGSLGTDDAFLQKPFTPRILAEKVREISGGLSPV